MLRSGPLRPSHISSFVLVAVALALCIAVPDVPLFIFASALAGVFLRFLGRGVARFLPLTVKQGIAAALVALVLVVATAGYFAAPQIAEQSAELSSQFGDMGNRWNSLQSESRVAEWLSRQLPNIADVSGFSGPILSRLGVAFGSVFGFLVNIFLIGVVGLYLSLDAGVYVEAITRLFPPPLREDTGEILHKLGAVLEAWLAGQFFSMAVLGVCVYVGLTLFGVPMALLFALFTAVLTFIPNLGPVLSVIPPTLSALATDAWLALWVLVFYVIIQIVEGNFLTPMVMKEAISMPPAFLITSQILLAALFGFWGLVLAAPLSAAGMVLIEELHSKPMEGAVESVPAQEPAETSPASVGSH